MPGPRRSVLVLLLAVTAALVLPTLAHAEIEGNKKIKKANYSAPLIPLEWEMYNKKS